MKVFELAQELNMTSKQTYTLAQKLGFKDIKHQIHELTDEQADAIRAQIGEVDEKNTYPLFGVAYIDGKWGVLEFSMNALKKESTKFVEFYTKDISSKGQAIIEMENKMNKSRIFKRE